MMQSTSRARWKMPNGNDEPGGQRSIELGPRHCLDRVVTCDAAVRSLFAVDDGNAPANILDDPVSIRAGRLPAVNIDGE
jgi:hypothetical protein